MFFYIFSVLSNEKRRNHVKSGSASFHFIELPAAQSGVEQAYSKIRSPRVISPKACSTKLFF